MNISQPSVDLNPHAWAEVARILGHYVPNRNVWAFGSRAKWTAKSHSDLDLALIGDEPLPLEELSLLKEAFDESVLPFRVDIVDWASTSESFRKIIEKDKVVVQTGNDQANRVAWKAMALEDCLDALIDYRGKTPEKTASGIPLVTAKVIKAGRIETPTEFIAAGDYDTWMRRGIPRSGDVVMTTEAPLGEVAQLGGEKVALAQRVIALRGKENLLDNTYLLYLLQSEEMQEQLKARATGTTVLGIKQSELRKVTLRVPPIAFQKAAAATLKALDDRISLLRETNATLEAIAQALFKSWFVDFDPVRAKMEGRAPEGIHESTAALFPNALEESELGWVPKGWHHSKLADICTYLSRGLSPKYIEHGGVLVLNQKCIRDFSVDYAKGRRHDPALRKIDGRELAIGDVLVNSTGVGTLGRVAQVLELPEQAVVDSHVTVVRAGAALSWPYLGQWMAKKQPEIETMGEGSTGQTELSRTKLGELMVLVPSKQALVAFDSVVEPLKNRVSLNERTAQTLTTLRDTLLPRLISGQLRLPEAQALVAAA